ncbi:MAG: alpha/beta fold hydrolase [Desulfobacteraceae bacterium]|nr:alpha/beta fold hydrolase [Desulfobacteraceae bacterium]
MPAALPYPFTPKTLVIDGQRMSYLDEGQGPAIVMVHGNPTWSFFYRRLVLALRDRFRVIVPDHIGCGLSDKPQDYPYTLARHTENLTRLIERLDLGRVSLVVHDWGGAIGLGFAGQRPEMIRSLLILNTAAFPAARLPWSIALCRLPGLGALLVRGLNLFSLGAIHLAAQRKLPAPVARGFLLPYDSWRNRVAVHAFVRDIPRHPGHPSWPVLCEVERNLARLVHLPMLILWGGKDFCFNDYFYHEWCRRFPQARRRYFPAAGHYLLEDAGAEIEPLARECFLEHGG